MIGEETVGQKVQTPLVARASGGQPTRAIASESS